MAEGYVPQLLEPEIKLVDFLVEFFEAKKFDVNDSSSDDDDVQATAKLETATDTAFDVIIVSSSDESSSKETPKMTGSPDILPPTSDSDHSSIVRVTRKHKAGERHRKRNEMADEDGSDLFGKTQSSDSRTQRWRRTSPRDGQRKSNEAIVEATVGTEESLYTEEREQSSDSWTQRRRRSSPRDGQRMRNEALVEATVWAEEKREQSSDSWTQRRRTSSPRDGQRMRNEATVGTEEKREQSSDDHTRSKRKSTPDGRHSRKRKETTDEDWIDEGSFDIDERGECSDVPTQSKSNPAPSDRQHKIIGGHSKQPSVHENEKRPTAGRKRRLSPDESERNGVGGRAAAKRSMNGDQTSSSSSSRVSRIREQERGLQSQTRKNDSRKECSVSEADGGSSLLLEAERRSERRSRGTDGQNRRNVHPDVSNSNVPSAENVDSAQSIARGHRDSRKERSVSVADGEPSMSASATRAEKGPRGADRQSMGSNLPSAENVDSARSIAHGHRDSRKERSVSVADGEPSMSASATRGEKGPRGADRQSMGSNLPSAENVGHSAGPSTSAGQSRARGSERQSQRHEARDDQGQFLNEPPNRATRAQAVCETSEATSSSCTTLHASEARTSCSPGPSHWPPQFRSLQTVYKVSAPYLTLSALQPNDGLINTIAVVCSFAPPLPTSGHTGDDYMKIYMVDPSSHDTPTELMFFTRDASKFPEIFNVGDIVRLHRVKTRNYEKRVQLLSNMATSVMVFSGAGREVVCKESGRHSHQTATVSADAIGIIKTLKRWVESNKEVLRSTQFSTLSDIEEGGKYTIIGNVVRKSRDGNMVVLNFYDGTIPPVHITSPRESPASSDAEPQEHPADWDLRDHLPRNKCVQLTVTGKYAVMASRVRPGQVVVVHAAMAEWHTYIRQWNLAICQKRKDFCAFTALPGQSSFDRRYQLPRAVLNPQT